MTLQTPYIKIDEHGIDLIKNYQVYRHIEYNEIKQIDIKRSHLINNWKTALIAGIATISAGLFVGIWIIKSNFHTIDSRISRGQLMFEVSPWLLAIGGLFLIYQAFRKSEVMIIYTSSNRNRIALKEFEDEKRINELIDFLSKRVRLNIN